MKIILAPMEGVVDEVIRHLITQMGGVDFCVTEFVRVTDRLVPAKVLYKYCPELHNNCKTEAGTPVFIQFLGGQPGPMGENAQHAAELGAYGIDINFGCPAKKVNQHDGGAALLKEPKRVELITSAVRRAVPKHLPVTAKVRLGFDHKEFANDIALAAEAGGAKWLTVHARTKTEAYRPPAHWEYIAMMQEAVSIPIIANGDIWSVEDYKKCKEVSGCDDVMLGRGLIAKPDLALQIKQFVKEKKSPHSSKGWSELSGYLKQFVDMSSNSRTERYALQRSKQLSKMMARNYPEALQFFDSIKRCQEIHEIKPFLP